MSRSKSCCFFFPSGGWNRRLQGAGSSDVCSTDLRRCCNGRCGRGRNARCNTSCIAASRVPTPREAPINSGRPTLEGSEERRVGEECRYRGSPDHLKKKILSLCMQSASSGHFVVVW